MKRDTVVKEDGRYLYLYTFEPGVDDAPDREARHAAPEEPHV